MKKLLLGLGSIAGVLPVSAIIACGASGDKPKQTQQPKETPRPKQTQQPKETPKPKQTQQPKETSKQKSSEGDQKPVTVKAIADNIKKALESAIFNSNKDGIDLANLSLSENNTWFEVKKDLGISIPTNDDGNPSFSEESLNKKDIKISFSKVNDYLGKLAGVDKEVILTIKKDNTDPVTATLHIVSAKLSSDIEIKKTRDKIYYWDKAPRNLASKAENASVTLSELGVPREYLPKSHFGLLASSTNVTFIVTKPLNSETNEITLSVNVNYNKTEEKTKEITIRYNFLTFEAVKNATAKIDNGILDISKDSSKSDSWAKIEKLSWEKDSYKKLFKNYFDNSKDSFKEVYYMTKFMIAATNPDNIALGTFGVVSEKGDKTLTPSDKYSLLENKIFNSKFDIQETAQGIISKFLGDDPDLNYSIVQLGGTVNQNDKILNKGVMWDSASPSMGGDETVKYIISKIGYTLV